MTMDRIKVCHIWLYEIQKTLNYRRDNQFYLISRSRCHTCKYTYLEQP